MRSTLKFLLNTMVVLFAFTSQSFAGTFIPDFLSGSYFTKMNNNHMTANPLILTSGDRGQSWSLIKNIPVISNQISEEIIAITCTKNTCIGGGIHYTEYPDYQLVLMKSDDMGKHWDFINNIAGFPHATTSAILGINCNDANCLAYGEYTPTGSKSSEGLILRSKDYGLSWAFVNDMATPPHPRDDVVVQYAHCEGSACVGLYNRFHAKKDFELISRPIYSLDKGKSWTYVKDIEGLEDNQNLKLGAIKCQGDICNASGGYLLSNAPNLEKATKPIMLRSQDKGQHWQAIYDFAGLPEADEIFIKGLSYSNHRWIAVGDLTRPDTRQAPFILISKDKGKHWEHVNNFSNTITYHYGLNALSCTKEFCVTTGVYADPTLVKDNIPMFISYDHGSSFKMIDHIENFPPIKRAVIHDIQCKHTSCSALGSYDSPETTEPYQDLPFVLNSQDKGKHWKFVSLHSLFKDFHNIHLTGMSK